MAKKIIVIDDEPDLLKVTLLRLKKSGYEVFGGSDGYAVLELAHRVMPDLIILDVYLPGISGDEVTRFLKKDEKLKNIPVILISATTNSLLEKTDACGADSCLTKPFDPEELLKEVEKFLIR